MDEKDEPKQADAAPAPRLGRKCRKCGGLLTFQSNSQGLDGEFVCGSCGYRTYC